MYDVFNVVTFSLNRFGHSKEPFLRIICYPEEHRVSHVLLTNERYNVKLDADFNVNKS